ncbi:MAG: CbiX/SirB N-terminal domain-containing protein [Roseibium sp.]
MSGTRSPSLKEPVTEAILVSHGQPSDPQGGEERLSALAQKVRIELPEWTIRSATLAAPEQLDTVLEASDSEPLLVPIFMTDGWFTNTMLPERLGQRPVQQLAPLGVDPELPRMTARLLRTTAEQAGWMLEECEVLLTAHGSATSGDAATCTLQFADALKQFLPVKALRTGFLEQEPGIAEIASQCGVKTLELPFFAASGGHALDDVPEALDEAEFMGVRLPVLGEAWFIPELIAHSLKCASLKRIAA